MAFNIDRLSRTTLAFNAGALTLSDDSVTNGPAQFTYASADDAVAAVAGANYFNPESVIYDLKVDDIIMCVCSDANRVLRVAAISTTANPKTISTATF